MRLRYGRVNLGLVVSLLGSLLSLPLNRRVHLWLGVGFTLLAAVHTWQHRRQFTHYLHKERQEMDISSLYTKFSNSSAKVNLFLQKTQVLHYMPGRVRLSSQHLLNNPEIARQVSEHLETIPEIKQFTVNAATGSLLIHYSPEDVSRNPFLRDVEQLVAKQYGR
ncbi:HMA2 domain-containing protein [Sporomusa malonica]